ncbi:DUF4244 domain-containing protein [Streptomyces sp. P38-E01]|uniref:DUF4244 domain-containing protein n=1 Tax=Streptomyces tardus TaxID=2780544 RepID=A0A949N103_9ACTN|nr:DUF4244 domain-containing protein [Streptomyces tardus]MBU7597260.1 DUF4244 domain-containing protein [Streptomyces tardus]
MLMCPTVRRRRIADALPYCGRLRRAARWPRTTDAGMSTAEYAVATLAACAFAAVLYQVLTSSSVTAALQGLIERAFSSAV